MKLALKTLIAAALTVGAIASQAAVVSIDAASFVASGGQITFSEFLVGTTNPTYTAADYGGTGNNPGVSFGSYFVGQSVASVANPCPFAGVQPTGCVLGSPTGPLSLDVSDLAPRAVITGDGSHLGSPVLSGTPLFNGPIAMLFSTLQAGISFDGGFFNAIGTTRITAYGADGIELGSILNTSTGIQTLRLGTDDGALQIAGLLISLVAFEDAGFTIDNLSFGAIRPAPAGRTDPPGGQVPEPTSLALVGLALVGLGVARRRRLI